jgi:hypothetical protein
MRPDRIAANRVKRLMVMRSRSMSREKAYFGTLTKI